MRLTLPFYLLLFLHTSICLAQKNFTKGRIITVDKDTLIGFIDYREWIKSPDEIVFKQAMSLPSMTYHSNQLAGFIIDTNQEIYHSLDFALEILPRSSNKVMYSSTKEYTDRKRRIDSVSAFVRVSSAGKATLYHYVDKDAEPHFLLRKDDALEALVYHVVETKHYLAKFREYRSQLSRLLNDACKPLPIPATEYYASSMKKLIDNYNSCFGRELKAVAPEKDRGRWEYGLMAGVGYTKMVHVMAAPYRYTEVQGDANFTPVGGIFINYVFARGRGKFALLNELHTYHLKSNAFFDDEYFHYNMHYLGLQHLFRYTFYVGQPSVYAVAGFSYATIIKQNSTLKRRDGSVENLVSLPWAIRNDEQRAIAGVGVSQKRLMLETRYYRGNGFTTGANATAPNNRFEVVLKYNLGRLNR
jgi:hypothetical protein